MRKLIGTGLILLLVGWFFDWNWYLITAVLAVSAIANQIEGLSASASRQEQMLERLQEKIEDIQDRVSIQTDEIRFMEDRLSSESDKYHD